MAKIDFLHPGLRYCGETLRTASMGGTESSVVQLAEALAARGHEVTVFNGIDQPRSDHGVSWRPFGHAAEEARGEIGIAVAAPSAFDRSRFRVPVFWPHNPLRGFAQIRRGTVWQLLRTWPAFVLLGRYHAGHIPAWLPSSGRRIIEHGIHRDFFRRAPATVAPPPVAIFTSQPYRGLDWLLDLWKDIKQRVPAAAFHVFAPKPHQAAANARKIAPEGVSFRGNLSRPDLIGELAASRVMLIPGHQDETYCLAAAEAVASGVPLVTRGLGALSERVRDGVTGYIAPSREAFIERAVSLLTDDMLWLRMHGACLADGALTSWDARAVEWENLFESFRPLG